MGESLGRKVGCRGSRYGVERECRDGEETRQIRAVPSGLHRSQHALIWGAGLGWADEEEMESGLSLDGQNATSHVLLATI